MAHDDDKEKLGFQTPLFPPSLPPSITVPVKPAPGRPTIPREVFDPRDRSRRNMDRQYRKMQAETRRLKQAANEAERLRRLKAAKAAKLVSKLAKGNLLTLGFELGWALGDYLWPQGWFTPETPSQIFTGYTFPSNWTHWCNTGGASHWREGEQLYNHCEGGDCADSGVGLCGQFARLQHTATAPDHPLHTTAGTVVMGFAYHHELIPPRSSLGVYEAVQAYTKQDNDPSPSKMPTPTYEPGPSTANGLPHPLTGPFPSDHPEMFPLNLPMHFPTAPSFKDALPPPHSQGEGKHRPKDKTGVPPPPLVPFPVVEMRTPPGSPPPPDQVVDIDPPPRPGEPPVRGGGGSGGRVRHHTRPQKGRKPPRSKTKEKKLSVRSAANRAWIVLNLATEVFDFIDALHKGLPDDCQAKGASIDYGKKGGGNADPYAKAKAIYDCFDKLDWDKAVNAFINNQLEDMVVGMLGMASTKVNKVAGAVTGGGGAVVGRPQGLAEDYHDAQLKKAVKDGTMTKEEAKAADQHSDLPIPVVSYNEGTGSWEVEIPSWLTIR